MTAKVINFQDSVSGIVQPLDIKSTSPLSSDQSLHGLNFAIKDMFAIQGHTCGFGSPDWKNSHQPSTSNALCVQKTLEAGAHLVANTICDELAFSLDGINIHYGIPLNPRAPERIPGGSSSGPAAVVAQGLVDFALGTDTAGSTRVPASYCAIWGLRPSHGAISLDGVLPLGPSFDTVGLLAGQLETLIKVAQVLISDNGAVRPDKLIILPDCFALLDAAVAPPVVARAQHLRQFFKVVEEKSVVEDGLVSIVAHFATIRAREAWSCHGPWFESTAPNLSPAVAKRLLACRNTNEEEVAKSRQYRAQLREKFRDLLQGTVLCLPTTANLPPLKSASDQELETNRTLNLRLNSIASFLALPQINLPAGEPFGPGLSLIGGEGSDLTLLRLVQELKNVAGAAL